MVLAISLNQIVYTNTIMKTSCLAYQSGNCITCPYNFHIA